MKLRIPTSLLILLTGLPALAGTTAVPSFEQPLTPSGDSSWFCRCAVYGWAQGLDGDLTIRHIPLPVDVGFDDILEDLDIAFMGAFEFGRDRWSILTDINYSELESNVPLPPASPLAAGNLTQQQLLANVLFCYNVAESDTYRFDVCAGARFNWLEADLSAGPLTRSEAESWCDPIIGARLRMELSRSFYLRAAADIGGFGAASDLTWQTMAGIGWQFSESGGAFLGYRAIGTDYSKGGFGYDVTAHGPVIGAEFRF